MNLSLLLANTQEHCGHKYNYLHLPVADIRNKKPTRINYSEILSERIRLKLMVNNGFLRHSSNAFKSEKSTPKHYAKKNFNVILSLTTIYRITINFYLIILNTILFINIFRDARSFLSIDYKLQKINS